MSRFRRATALAAAALLLGTGSVAYADNLNASGDELNAKTDTLSFGDVVCGSTVSSDVGLTIVRTGAGGGGNVNPNTYANGATVTISGSASPGDVVSVHIPRPEITLAEDWLEKKNNEVGGSVDASLVLTAAEEGPGSARVTFLAAGARAEEKGDPTLTRSAAFDVTWNTLECATNTAPSAPGAPVASSNPNQGGFTLTWGAAADDEGDAFSYTLEGKDSDDADFSVIASGLTATDYTFAAGQPAEGTWVYRVKAVESDTSPALQSDYSATSQPVKVDRTAPNAPSAAADRGAEYTDAATSWWKDSVTVSFTGAGDPDLPDSSAGSGVASVTGPQTYSTHGSFSATGTATDNAGNVSDQTVFVGSVDAIAPVVTATAPGAAFVKGSTATIAWNATDQGSGLATAPSGTITVDTSTVGTHTVTIPAGTAKDNVGHESQAVEVTYSVVYAFNGFFQPVDMDRVNVAKAGSAIPLKFSLGGYQGMGVIVSAKFFATGGEQAGDPIEETVAASNSGLSYDAAADQYVYVWKTEKALGGKSGILKVTLDDGTTRTVEFSFRK